MGWRLRASDERLATGRRLTTGRDSAGEVFATLGDPTRRRILTLVADREGATASALARELPISRQAVQKHLASLESAGLVTAARQGRERVFRVTPGPLSDAVGWIADVGAEWDDRLAALRSHLDPNRVGTPRAGP
jgi:DNA-binding transcriptional ArsR family regulator